MGAVISECEKYRYVLTRKIPQAVRWVKPCLFIMLNPSTADAELDDPTIRRCMGFAKEWLCTELTVVNIFALRATDPKELYQAADPIGPENDKHLWEQIDKHSVGGVIVAAWGAHKIAEERGNKIAEIGLQCLGKTKNGSPRHPLYLKRDAALELL